MSSSSAALLLDLALGEPPDALHPTVWMGRWLGAARRRRRSRSPLGSLAEGAAWLAAGALWTTAAVGAAEQGASAVPRPWRSAARGVLLKPALSLRALLAAGAAVERSLEAGDLPRARRLLGWHLVSRETGGLSRSEVAGAAIESLAENLSDSVVAPLLAFRAGGLRGAYLYRLINTADAMLGYRTPELEWFGKAAARVDDGLNWVPARIATLLIAGAAPLGGGSSAAALRIALRDAGKTASPNAGWPMAAMAGALGVRLTKRDAYVLHPHGREPTAADLRRARFVVAGSGVLAAHCGA